MAPGLAFRGSDPVGRPPTSPGEDCESPGEDAREEPDEAARLTSTRKAL